MLNRNPTPFDYRKTIYEAYQHRRQKNPGYSLRSYARDLCVSPSMLSEVLSYKKKLSRKTATKITTALSLSKSDERKFLLSVDLEQPSSLNQSGKILNDLEKANSIANSVTLNQKDFSAIRDYRHFVAIALFGLKQFKPNLMWIAGQLGVFQSQARSILVQLQKIGAIKFNQREEPELVKSYLQSPIGLSSESIRSYHRNTLHIAMGAIDSVPVHERTLHGQVFAIDSADFSKIQDEMRAFQKEIYQRYAEKGNADRVYSLQMQFIPLTPKGTS